MLESLNYSFRNPKNIIWVTYRIKQLRNYKKNHGVLRGPQLDKQRWRARLGILRVKEPPRHSVNRTILNLWLSLNSWRWTHSDASYCAIHYGRHRNSIAICPRRTSARLPHVSTDLQQKLVVERCLLCYTPVISAKNWPYRFPFKSVYEANRKCRVFLISLHRAW